uniref:Uncharacterized protein n=1 Tax=Arundo donax TaxID=35708 RepID=A0A0A9D0I7_ARUDO
MSYKKEQRGYAIFSYGRAFCCQGVQSSDSSSTCSRQQFLKSDKKLFLVSLLYISGSLGTHLRSLNLFMHLFWGEYSSNLVTLLYIVSML